MKLIHVKMKNGEDVLAYLGEQDTHRIELITPIAVVVDPTYGMFAKSWLMLSELNSITININNIMFFSTASRKAIDYYDEFMHRLAEGAQRQSVEDDTEFTSELEEIFGAMMDSKSSIKH